MSVETHRRAGTEPAEGRPSRCVRLAGIKKYFPIKQGIIFQKTVGNVHAVDGVDLEIYPGETVGLVGETGLRQVDPRPRVVMRLYEPTEGQIFFEGQDITQPDGAQSSATSAATSR